MDLAIIGQPDCELRTVRIQDSLQSTIDDLSRTEDELRTEAASRFCVFVLDPH